MWISVLHDCVCILVAQMKVDIKNGLPYKISLARVDYNFPENSQKCFLYWLSINTAVCVSLKN